MLLLILILFTFTITSKCDDCSCGYAINNGSTIFIDRLETDFLHVSNLTKDTASAWIPQAYISTPEDSHGPFGKLAQLANVIPNPVASIYDWGGPGIRGDSPGLQLWVRSILIPGSNGLSSLVPIAEIVSNRSDILYGSFRVAFRTSSVNGTCAAFFTYFDDSSEVDVELLSHQRRKINFVIQSPQTATIGYVPPSSLDFGLEDLQNDPATTYNEYRVDWLPGRVEFFVNGVSLKVMTENVPSRPARLHMIHWSDGNPGWSGGPPLSDAVLTVSYIKAYFNSSSLEKRDSSKADCRPCPVPDVDAPPDPMGSDGNVTGRTFFFDDTQVVSHSARKGDASNMKVNWLPSLIAAIALICTYRLLL